MIHAILLTLLLGAGQIQTGELNKGLTFYAPLTSGYIQSATVASNLAPSDVVCTANGTPAPTYGADGVDFDGSDQYIRCAVGDDTVTFTDGAGNDEPFSISMWANPHSASGFRAVVSDHFGLYSNPGGNLLFLLSDGTDLIYVATSLAPYVNSWHIFTGTYDGSNLASGIKIYIDGVDIAASETTVGVYDGLPAETYFNIGASGDPPAAWANGEIAYVRIWNRQLSAADAAYLDDQDRRVVAMETGSLQKGLVASWHPTTSYLADSTTVRDLTPYGQEMTSIGGGTIGATGITLNGSSQYLNYNVANFRSTDNTGTILCWATPTATGSVFASADKGADSDFITLSVITGSSVQYFHRDAGTSFDLRTDAAITVPGEHQIGASSNGSRVQIIIDGVVVVSTVNAGANSGQWFNDFSSANIDNVSLGVLNRSSITSYLTGEHHSCDVYNRELSAAEIAQHYAQGPRVVAFETGYSYKGLVASWPLTSDYKASATVMRDAGVSGYEVTLSGAPTIDGDGMTLDGTEYAERTVADFRSSDSSGTIACWFKATVANGFLFASSDEASTTRRLQLQLSSSGGIRVRQENADTADDIQANDTDFTDGNWHLAAVSSSGTAYSIYTDGTVESSLTVVTGSNSGDWFADTPNRDNITLGVLHTSAGYANHLTGTLAYCKIFDVALSAAEHGYLYAYVQRP